MTAGTLPARRVRRAPPLPNSVRFSADSRTSDTAVLLERSGSRLVQFVAVPRRELVQRTVRERASTTDTASITNPRCDPSPGNPLTLAAAAGAPARRANPDCPGRAPG